MAPHSSTLAWKIPWTEEPGSSMGSLRDMTKQLHFHLLLSCIGEGNGNLLQCSCLENPRDRGAWWAAVYGVTQSWTSLKQQQQQQGIFNFSYCILQLCLFLLFIFSLLEVLLCSSILLLSSVSVFMISTLKSSLDKLLISTVLSSSEVLSCF